MSAENVEPGDSFTDLPKLDTDKGMLSPDYQEVIDHILIEAWIKFAAASLAAGSAPPTAAAHADQTLIMFNRRFLK